jgi:hypothetical protein
MKTEPVKLKDAVICWNSHDQEPANGGYKGQIEVCSTHDLSGKLSHSTGAVFYKYRDLSKQEKIKYLFVEAFRIITWYGLDAHEVKSELMKIPEMESEFKKIDDLFEGK